MAFVEQILNDGETERIDRGFIRRVSFDVKVQRLPNDFEKRNYNGATAGRRSYTLDFSAYSPDAMALLESYYIAAQGEFIGFRFYDCVDNQITDELIGTGDAAEDEFQASKTYAWGALSRVRKLYKLFGTQVVKLDDVVQVADFTVNNNTGIVSFTTPPGIGVTVKLTTQYHIPVRFDSDSANIQVINGKVRNWGNVNLIELINLEEILS